MTGVLRLMRLPIVIGLIVLAVSCRAGLIARYQIIEPDDIYALCLPETRPGWCAPRDALVDIAYTFSFGYTAVAAAVLAWWCRPRLAWWFAMAALLAGGIGLHLYQTGVSALGVLLALLRLPRLTRDVSQAPRLGPQSGEL
jgi:hypothetical protein